MTSFESGDRSSSGEQGGISNEARLLDSGRRSASCAAADLVVAYSAKVCSNSDGFETSGDGHESEGLHSTRRRGQRAGSLACE